VDGRNAGQFKAGGMGCLLHQARNWAALIHSQGRNRPSPTVRDWAVSRFKTL
jgi:hypothetical protein